MRKIITILLLLVIKTNAVEREVKMKEVEEIYEAIYGKNNLLISTDEMNKFVKIESIIGHKIPKEIISLISINPHSEYVFLGHEPYSLNQLHKVYTSLNYQDAKLMDFTQNWKENPASGNLLKSNLQINQESDKPFVVNKDSCYIKDEQGLEYDDADFEVYYDLSFFLPISEFDGEYLFVDLSEKNYGRLLFYPELGVGDVDVLAPNLKTHLEDLIMGLENGRYDEFDDIPSSWFERNQCGH